MFIVMLIIHSYKNGSFSLWVQGPREIIFSIGFKCFHPENRPVKYPPAKSCASCSALLTFEFPEKGAS